MKPQSRRLVAEVLARLPRLQSKLRVAAVQEDDPQTKERIAGLRDSIGTLMLDIHDVLRSEKID